MKKSSKFHFLFYVCKLLIIKYLSRLLTYTKLTENIIQEVIGSNSACDFT